MSKASHKLHFVTNGNGWLLEVKQCHPPKKLDKKRRPVAIIPGYGMNSFIFGYHPSGQSMEEYFTRRGLEVWSVNLREQGRSARLDGSRRYGLHDLGAIDLKAAVNFIAEQSQSSAKKVDLIGCSLGGTVSYIYGSEPQNKLGSLVTIGAPLRWEEVHPLLRVLFASPRLIGMIPIRGTREIVRKMLPYIADLPLIHLYLHPELIDMSKADEMVNLVEDPNRHINRQIAQWIRDKDLIMNGKNLTDEFRSFKNPLLCVLANGDGIVPPLTALSALEVCKSKVKETLMVGDDKQHYAHGDLFVSYEAHQRVFRPIADWLLKLDP
jgi:pimeloyl-ACP methyl ester carboxylesterase